MASAAPQERRGQAVATAASRSGERPLPAPRRYNDHAARVVKLVDTADLKSADAETRRAGSSPALGTKNLTDLHHHAQVIGVPYQPTLRRRCTRHLSLNADDPALSLRAEF
jgi:hypothetical protein